MLWTPASRIYDKQNKTKQKSGEIYSLSCPGKNKNKCDRASSSQVRRALIFFDVACLSEGRNGNHRGKFFPQSCRATKTRANNNRFPTSLLSLQVLTSVLTAVHNNRKLGSDDCLNILPSTFLQLSTLNACDYIAQVLGSLIDDVEVVHESVEIWHSFLRPITSYYYQSLC